MLKLSILIGLGAGIVLACADNGRCGASSVASVCPPPAVGFAVVEGTLLSATGSVMSGRQVYVSCGPVVGAYDQRTNTRGAFRIALSYGSLEGPPPLDADGMFRLSCRVFAVGLPANDIVTVPFAPKPEAVIPISVLLQESH